MTGNGSSELINGKYRLLKKLGNGAFGSVHLAEQEVYGISLRTVALKIFETEIRDTIHAREIFNDAIILVRLLDRCDDMYIKSLFVQIYDIGSLGSNSGDERGVGKGYLAMELMEKDLRSIVGETGSSKFRKTTVTEALSYMTPVVDALAYMHSQNPPVLHRDLKPDNVLFKYRDGVQIKVADFGLAIQLFDITGPVRAAGTMNYQDLESFSLGTASTESDVYAMGMMFYELLTGRYPVDFDYSIMNQQDALGKKICVDTLELAVSRPVVPPSEYNLELKKDAWLEEIIMKSLKPYRKDRIKDVAELGGMIKNRNTIPSGRTINEKYKDFVREGDQAIAGGNSHWEEAEKAYKEAAMIMPKKCQAVMKLAHLYSDMGKTKKAEEILNERVKKGWECSHLYGELSYLWGKRKIKVMAKKYRERSERVKTCKFSL